MEIFRNGDHKVVLVLSDDEARIAIHLLRESGSQFDKTLSKLRDSMELEIREFLRSDATGRV